MDRSTKRPRHISPSDLEDSSSFVIESKEDSVTCQDNNEDITFTPNVSTANSFLSLAGPSVSTDIMPDKQAQAKTGPMPPPILIYTASRSPHS